MFHAIVSVLMSDVHAAWTLQVQMSSETENQVECAGRLDSVQPKQHEVSCAAASNARHSRG